MSDLEKMLFRAMDLKDDGEVEQAIALFTRVITEDETNAQAYHERAMAYLEIDDEAAAIADFDRALAIDPEFPGARDWRARASEALGDHLAAAQDRLQDLRDNPDGPYEGAGVIPQDWADCARSFVDAGDPETAVELLEEYFDEHEQKVTSYATYETAPMRLLAELRLRAGDAEDALRLARRACESEHSKPADDLMLARALEASGELDAARAKVDELLDFNEYWEPVLQMRDRLDESTE